MLASEWAHGPSKEAMLRGLRERLAAVLASPSSEPSMQLRHDPDGSFPVLLLCLVRGMLERDRYGLPLLDAVTGAPQIVDFFLKGAGL